MNKPSNELIKKVLNNKGNKTEAKQVVKWFATNEGVEYLNFHIDEHFNELPTAHFSKEQVLNNITEKIVLQKKYSFFCKVAAVVIPLILFSVSFWFLKPNNTEMLALTTKKGEIKTVTLTDGTIVHLNPETQIIFPEKFKKTRRKVQLNGEAYFNVAKDSTRPFIIELQKSAIEVLGTSFNVKSYTNENNVDVILEEGSIAFKPQNASSSKLIAGETINYNKHSGVVQKSKLSQKIAYLKGKDNVIIFNNNNLQTVLNTLNRWYDVSFIVKDSVAHKLSYTTFFKNASLQEVLLELETISPIRFKKKDNLLEVYIR